MLSATPRGPQQAMSQLSTSDGTFCSWSDLGHRSPHPHPHPPLPHPPSHPHHQRPHPPEGRRAPPSSPIWWLQAASWEALSLDPPLYPCPSSPTCLACPCSSPTCLPSPSSPTSLPCHSCLQVTEADDGRFMTLELGFFMT